VVPDNALRRALSLPLTVEDFQTASSTVKVEVGARSHRGAVRAHNDDHFLVLRLSRAQDVLTTSLPKHDLPPHFEESGYAMFVADGLGPGGAGSLASRVALSTVVDLVLRHGKWNLRVDATVAADVLANAAKLYEQIDQAVIAQRHALPELADMATSLTAAYSAGDQLFIAHVGHSRAYLFRDGTLTRLTRDHTIEQHVADGGGLIAMERRGTDQRHILTHALGARGDRPLIRLEHFRIADCDTVLLCTNGLTDMVDEDALADTLAERRSPEEQCQALIDLAIQKGGQDNITIVIAQYEIPSGS
jgi:serine/threonine protein phosphatase PrpC